MLPCFFRLSPGSIKGGVEKADLRFQIFSSLCSVLSAFQKQRTPLFILNGQEFLSLTPKYLFNIKAKIGVKERTRFIMQLIKQFGGTLAVSLLALGLYGCPKPKAEETGLPVVTVEKGTGDTGKGAEGEIKIAFIPKGTSHSFWQMMKAGADKAATEEKVTLMWQGPDKENDITSQINLVQTQANSGVKGVALCATDANALIKPVEDLMAKGISVVTIDSGITKDVANCYIATDNVEGGRKAGEELAKSIGGKGEVGLLFFLQGSVSNDERVKGFKEALAKYPDIKLVTSQQANDPTEALNATTNMLTANSKIVGLFAANEPNGVGAANYIRQNKKTGIIKLVAFDSSKEEVAALEEGVISSLIVQDPYRMGYEGVKTVLKAIRKQPIEKKFINSGVFVVSKSNMQNPEIQKLLDPAKR